MASPGVKADGPVARETVLVRLAGGNLKHARNQGVDHGAGEQERNAGECVGEYEASGAVQAIRSLADKDGTLLEPRELSLLDLDRGPGTHLKEGGDSRNRHEAKEEIGRASCRERVS